MSDNERRLLAKMTTADGMKVVVEAKLGREVFETPILSHVFAWMLDYWAQSTPQRAPTLLALETQFPALKDTFPAEAEVEESTGWLIEVLQKRYLVNELQRLTYETVETGVDDPVGTLARLIEDATATQDRAGATDPPRYDPAAVTKGLLWKRNQDEIKRRYQQETQGPDAGHLRAGC